MQRAKTVLAVVGLAAILAAVLWAVIHRCAPGGW